MWSRHDSGMLSALSMTALFLMCRISRPGLGLGPAISRGSRAGMNRLEVRARADAFTIGGNIARDGRSEQRGDSG
jgi:hypothetical protein